MNAGGPTTAESRHMNLRSIDLNLLVALDALLSEQHVTRAADRIGLSQPAMSNALARLRHLFQDELLVRTATGMQATARAQELAEPTRQVLRQIERVFERDAGFDVATSARTFTIRLSDLLGLLLLPRLLEDIGREAASIGFDIVHMSPADTVEALEKDEIDLAVSTGLEHSTSIKSMPLLHDRMVCVMRASHAAAIKMSMRTFLAARHLRVSMSPTDLRFVDDTLAKRGITRNVALNVPHWLIVPHVLERTDLIGVMPHRLAQALASKSLAIRELPFASHAFDWSMYWHRRHDGNPAVAWLRARLTQVAQALG
jgi:DNA-binding transcriptional LysR family regulator